MDKPKQLILLNPISQTKTAPDIQRADRDLKLSIDKKVSAEFADFLINQLPDLFEAFTKSGRDKENDEA